MIRWLNAVLLGAPLVVGCVDQTRVDLDKRLTGLIGTPEAELVRRLDLPPTRVDEAGGTKFLAYYMAWPDLVIFGPRPIWAPTYNAPELLTRHCEITYAIRDGKVAGYSYEGTSCGWGGYPVIKPA